MGGEVIAIWILICLVVFVGVPIIWFIIELGKIQSEFGRQLHRDFDTLEKRQDILIREIQDFKLSLERNTDASKVGGERISVFGNQLDAAFKYHKDEVQDLLDRLQAKSLSEVASVQRMRMDPEQIAKLKLQEEEVRKKRDESNGFYQQQKRLRTEQQEHIG